MKKNTFIDVPVVLDFSDVLLENLLGVPLKRQTEFRNVLVLGVALIANAPHRLAPP